jgi:hypothetical protein
MKRFIAGTDRGQSTLFPECLEDWIDENNPVQVIDVFIDELDPAELVCSPDERSEIRDAPDYRPLSGQVGKDILNQRLTGFEIGGLR